MFLSQGRVWFSAKSQVQSNPQGTGSWGGGNHRQGHRASWGKEFPGTALALRWQANQLQQLESSSPRRVAGVEPEKQKHNRDGRACRDTGHPRVWASPAGASSWLLQSISCNSCLWFSFSFYSPFLCPTFQLISQPMDHSFIRQILIESYYEKAPFKTWEYVTEQNGQESVLSQKYLVVTNFTIFKSRSDF